MIRTFLNKILTKVRALSFSDMRGKNPFCLKYNADESYLKWLIIVQQSKTEAPPDFL